MGNILCVAGDLGEFDEQSEQPNRLAAHPGTPDQGDDKAIPGRRAPFLDRISRLHIREDASIRPHRHPTRKMSEPGKIEEEVKEACREAVLSLFPDICPDFLRRICEEQSHDYERAVTHILDQSENGKSYPKRPRLSRKRKRSDDDAEESDDGAKRFDNDERRRQPKHLAYLKTRYVRPLI